MFNLFRRKKKLGSSILIDGGYLLDHQKNRINFSTMTMPAITAYVRGYCSFPAAFLALDILPIPNLEDREPWISH